MELTVDQALQKGIEAHRAGKAQEADKYYTAILKAQPKHPDANHNMGALAVGLGKVQEALPFFKAALEANTNIAQFWLSYIDALIKLNQLEKAKDVLAKAKRNGAKGDRFDQIEKRLSKVRKATAVKNSNAQEPPQEKLLKLISLYKQKKLKKVFSEAQKLTKQYAGSLTLWNLLGASAAQIGQLDDSIFAFQKALLIKPNFYEAHNNIGNAFKDQGKLEEAIAAFKKAISIKPDFPEAYNNLGNAFKDQGKLEEAIVAFNKAISIKPDFSGAYYNIGNALKDQDKLVEAIEAYTKALSIKPDYAEVYNNMGIVLKKQGKPVEAIEAYTKALAIKPDYAEAFRSIGFALQSIIFNKPNRELQKTIVSLLDKKIYIRPKDIAKAAISLLKLESTLQKHLQLPDGYLIENPIDVISDLSELPLLLELMRVCPIPDLELEKLFIDLRRSILSNISSLKEASPEFLLFQSALALQCFTNEYLYNHTEEEKDALQSLETNLKKVFKNDQQPSPQIILTIASYKSLNQYDWCKFLVVTDDIQEVYARQIEEPNEEEKLKQDLNVLGEITDSISSEVRSQYEESPYPRWVNLGLHLRPMPISNVLHGINLKLHDNRITEVEEPDILIAGCGTGQHSIGTASRFKSSNVLAIDLSLSSLAFAKRKSEELAIENIEYMQADILDLGQLNKKFDIIESAGVLHHMNDPVAGWKVLIDCLRQGGLINIGLYSELARKHIVKIREEISEAGIGSSKMEMRSFRDIIIKSNQDHHKLILNSPAFYSLSTLKDLLFHVQEHRFTIPQIKDCLDELGLRFCGFEENNIVAHFKQTNTCKEDPYDLDKWHSYEKANPQVFAGMYQFWCQKVDLD